MPVHNTDIAGIFDEIADFLEIEGENPFRIRAYRNASRTVSGLGSELKDMVAGGCWSRSPMFPITWQWIPRWIRMHANAATRSISPTA